ncbi:hypothetical protein ACQ5RP_02855 [Limosilactobacillus fermentum]
MKRNKQVSQDNCSNASSGDFNSNNISDSDVFFSKVTNNIGDPNKFIALQEFINSFFEKAGALHSKIGECAGKDTITDLVVI